MTRTSERLESWRNNALRWLRAVRNDEIRSRREVTNAAILAEISKAQPRRLLDAGCGEGWLIRAVRKIYPSCETIGFDVVPALIEAARQKDRESLYFTAAFADHDRINELIAGDIDMVVCNFSLFDEEDVRALDALRRVLTQNGRVLIQTLPGQRIHTREGLEDFSVLGEGWQTMPYRNLSEAAWNNALRDAGYEIRQKLITRSGETDISWILHTTPAPSNPLCYATLQGS